MQTLLGREQRAHQAAVQKLVTEMEARSRLQLEMERLEVGCLWRLTQAARSGCWLACPATRVAWQPCLMAAGYAVLGSFGYLAQVSCIPCLFLVWGKPPLQSGIGTDANAQISGMDWFWGQLCDSLLPSCQTPFMLAKYSLSACVRWCCSSQGKLTEAAAAHVDLITQRDSLNSARDSLEDK